jgi:hypothetical protein
MTFEEIVDQALAMLQRRGRVTYRALQLQFKLDEAALEALKGEILSPQSQAVDGGGRGQVWVGGHSRWLYRKPQRRLLPHHPNRVPPYGVSLSVLCSLPMELRCICGSLWT